MRKKIIYIGIVLLAVAVATLLLSGSIANVHGLLTEQNVTVSSLSFSAVPIVLANNSIPLVIGRFSSKVNFYFFNGTGFSDWTKLMNKSNAPLGYASALSLKGYGLLFAYLNTTSVILPYQPGVGNFTPAYFVNSSKGFPGGTYYAVIDNSKGSLSSASQVNATLLYNAQGSNGTAITKFIYEEAVFGITFFILLIAGIIIIIYGFIKKPKEGMDAMQTSAKPSGSVKSDIDEKEIDELYKRIKKKGKKSSNR